MSKRQTILKYSCCNNRPYCRSCSGYHKKYGLFYPIYFEGGIVCQFPALFLFYLSYLWNIYRHSFCQVPDTQQSGARYSQCFICHFVDQRVYKKPQSVLIHYNLGANGRFWRFGRIGGTDSSDRSGIRLGSGSFF